MKNIILVLFAIVLFGCSTLEKKITKAKLIAYENPASFADFCNKIYPAKDSIGETKTVYVKAENEDYSKEIEDLANALNEAENKLRLNKCDSNLVKDLKKQIINLKANYKPCKSDTIYKTNTIYKKDTSTETLLTTANIKLEKQSLDIADKTSEIKDLKSDRIWYIIAIVLLSLSLIGCAYLIFKPKFL